MWLETEGLNGLTTLAGRDHHLDNKGDTAGVEISYAGEIEKDAFGALRDSLIGAEYGGLRCAGYITSKAENGDWSPGVTSRLFHLHLSHILLHHFPLFHRVNTLLDEGRSPCGHSCPRAASLPIRPRRP